MCPRCGSTNVDRCFDERFQDGVFNRPECTCVDCGWVWVGAPEVWERPVVDEGDVDMVWEN